MSDDLNHPAPNSAGIAAALVEGLFVVTGPNTTDPQESADLHSGDPPRVDGLYAGGRLANIDVAVCDAVGELEQLTKAWLAHSEELIGRLKGRAEDHYGTQVVAGMVLKKLQTIRDLLQ